MHRGIEKKAVEEEVLWCRLWCQGCSHRDRLLPSAALGLCVEPCGSQGAVKMAPRPQLRLLKAISDALVFREGVWKVLGSADFQKMSFLAGLQSLNDRLWT